MKYVVNLLILALIGGLGYLLVNGIQTPIIFKAELDKRKGAVTERLQTIRSMQELHREIKGDFASTFDSLEYVLSTDSIPFVKLIADPEDPTNEDKFQKEVTYSAAIDSIRAMGIDLGQLQYVPYGENKETFEMKADTTTYQSINVPVMECMTRYKVFMGQYADAKFKQYDDTYEPEAKIGFGSMASPNLEGNWN